MGWFIYRKRLDRWENLVATANIEKPTRWADDEERKPWEFPYQFNTESWANLEMKRWQREEPGWEYNVGFYE